jgi:hypothetical protein
MQTNSKLLIVVKVLGGFIFIIQGFLLLLYWNWPFGGPSNRNYLTFIGLVVCMVGYLLALLREMYGGILMICGSILLATGIAVNPTVNSSTTALIFGSIIYSPSIILGALFIISHFNKKR